MTKFIQMLMQVFACAIPCSYDEAAQLNGFMISVATGRSVL